MNYSSIHLKISETYPDVLNDPEKYLGLNYATILNFWWFVDGINSEQAQVMGEFYDNTDNNTRGERYRQLDSLCNEYSLEIWDFVSDICAYTDFEYLAAWITIELMYMHELLDKGLSLLFVPMLGEL
jgi:hypothetical protein